MTINNPERIAFLKKIHLFRDLDEVQLAAVAAQLKEVSYPVGHEVIKQGDEAYDFFLIYSGTARVVKIQKENEQQLSILVPEDFFGEEALLSNIRRSVSVYIQNDALLLVLSREDFSNLLRQVHKLKTNFEVEVTSRRLSNKLQFDWLEPGEVIYFLARKHPVLLWQAMVLPVIALILPLGLLIGYIFTNRPPLFFLAVAAILLDIAWIVWRVVDWGNDYYIVTNLRVIWLEKIVALYDSRQEAPLSTILTVGVETDQLGRMLDYGDVVVRTFVGRIAFHCVPHPYQAASLIEEHWTRAKTATQRADIQALKLAIRKKLSLPVEEESKSSLSNPVPKVVTKRASRLKEFLDRVNIFKVRFEDKAGTITYRKHWIVLILQTLWPGVVFLVALVFSIYRVILLKKIAANGLSGGVADPLLAILIVVLIGSFLWWVYQYWDWSNDIFQVTLDQVYDIDRKPLGREEKKAAALDNILSTEADRRGLLQVLFNYGNVYISVGDTQMNFFDVYNPSAIQQDIDRRRVARIERKKKEQALADQDRMAEFFAMYHQSSDEFRKEEKSGEGDNGQNPQ